jgi:N-acetylglutamate synthase-like GNAT family acetyltransferase
MPMLREARKGDSRAIRSLIHEVGINPLGLDWRRFIVIVDENDHLLACGQVKPHGGGTKELASIAVRPGFRGKGFARRVIEELLKRNQNTLYLTCRDTLPPFYEKFGFHIIPPCQMPTYFRWVYRLVAFFSKFTRIPNQLRVMRRDTA